MSWPQVDFPQTTGAWKLWNPSVKIVHICEKHFTRSPRFIKHMVLFKHAATEDNQETADEKN